ncbi:MAG: tandem-95 repeat protein, partial [Oscillatoriales cyanobacterium C42_A2020_001]|nr:tandem-95 repeat protein [Leptolyngbyaceae cyanobacterium C42_A2020_001]
TNEDTVLSNNVLTNDSDPDGNTPLTVSLVTGPSNGSLSLNPNGTFSYTPNTNFNGTDTFTYSVRDSLGANSSPASVVLSVTAVNDAPVAVNDNYTISNTATLSVVAAGVLANDTDIDTAASGLTATLTTVTSNGALTLNPNGSFTYTPNSGFIGTDSFTYRTNDGSLNSGLATVTISVTGTTNTPPIAGNDTASGNEDTAINGNVLSNDGDPDGNTPLSATVVAGPSSGALSLNPDGTFSYTPNANFNGTDTFTYLNRDALGAVSNTATVVLTVNPVNDAPSFVVGANQSAIAGSGMQTVSNWATGFNPGAANETGQTIAGYTVVSNSNPSIFAAAPSINSAGTLTYTPATTVANATSAIIGVQVQDTGGTASGGTDLSTTQFFTVTVTPQATLSIAGVSQAEGSNGNTPYNFTVSLSAASSQTVSVNYATTDGTAKVTDNDYVAANGTLVFLPGETSKVISVMGIGDTKLEANETFTVNLSAPTNAALSTASATGTITNDDTQPTIRITGSNQAEGNVGQPRFIFTVSLSNPSSQTVSVNYTTEDGTATTADSDYLAASGTVIFAPGETSKTIAVDVISDKKVEPSETFSVKLSNPSNGAIATANAFSTIVNDDNATISDFNGDGTNDIVWRNASTGENMIWLMGSSMPISTITLPWVRTDWVLEGVGDFNKDGNPDILWREYIYGVTGVWTMSGGSVVSFELLPQVTTNWAIDGVSDFNGDGNADILWRDYNTGHMGIWYMDGTALASTDFLGYIPAEWIIQAIADVNNDGKVDLVWRNQSTGATASWLMYGNPGFLFYTAVALPGPSGANWDIAASGDYNRDGKTDFIWRNYANGANYIWFMDGTSSVGQVPTNSLPSDWYTA